MKEESTEERQVWGRGGEGRGEEDKVDRGLEDHSSVFRPILYDSPSQSEG